MKVIMTAGEIPLGATVTKKMGEKKYTLSEKVIIWGDTKERQQEIKADADTRFLMAQDMSPSISAISVTTELVWHVDSRTLYNALGKMHDEWDDE